MIKKKPLILFIIIFLIGFLIGDFESKKLKIKINDLKIKYFNNKDLKLDNDSKSYNKKIIKSN